MAEFLHREFSNHVYLGQWELARACALALIKSDVCDEHSKQLFLSSLQCIAKNPHIVRSAWTTVSCPSFVNFLACQLLLDVGCDNKVKTRKKEADFNILLETFIRSSKSVLIELSSIHSQLLQIEDGQFNFENSDLNFEISNGSISCLQSTFAENPVAISRLFNMLHIPKNVHLESNINTVICDIHFQNMLICLRSIKTMFLKSRTTQNLKELASKIYLLLTILPEAVLEESRLVNIDEALLTTIQLCKDHILDWAKVYQSFINRSSPALYQYFCKLQEQSEVNDFKTDSFQNVLKCYASDGTFCHQGALLKSVNSSTHFLQDLMDFSIRHILDGNWMMDQYALKDSLYEHLKPLILILSWCDCQSDISSMNVIQAVKSWDEESSDTIILEACKWLKLSTVLTDLCMGFYHELHPEASISEIQNKTRNILSHLQTDSALRVVHASFGIKNIPSKKIEEMLNVTQGGTLNSHDSSLHLTDQAVFSGYSAMASIMEAIHLSCEYKDLLFVKKLNISDILCAESKSFDQADCDDDAKKFEITIESLSEYIDNQGPHLAYSKFVLEKLKQAKKEIKVIFPIGFRIEVLENIFSLLFSMSNILMDSLEPFSDSDQGHEGELSFSALKKDLPSSQNENTQSSESEKIFTGRFVISTVKLKDCNDSKYPIHMSSKSTESNSSSGFQPYTFLCNELIVRDLLFLLKDSVMEANAEVYKAIGQSDSSVKNRMFFELSDSGGIHSIVGSSSKLLISGIELQERTSRLLQYVNEAMWRYEVVKSGIFQGAFGISPLERKKPYLFQSQYSASSSDGTDKESKKRRKKKRHKRNLANSKKESFAESSIIQCMLSSPEALLRYSLWSRNLKQAKQVIQLFHLEESAEAKEVILLQELQRISQKLAEDEKIKRKLVKRSSVSVVEGKSLMSSVQAIGDAAATGLRSSEICLIVHEELSSLKIPELVDITGGVRHPELLLGSENISSIFLADLGCTSGASLDLSTVLLDMASRTWNTSKETIQDLDIKILSKKKMPLIRGIFKTLGMMNSILKEFLNFENEESQDNLKPLFWPLGKSYNSFSQVLSNFIGSLDCQRFKEEVDSWKRTSILLEEFVGLIKEEEANEKHGVSEKDITRENKLHMTYKKLSKALRELRDWSSETIRPHQVRYDNYLSKLLIHLHQVTSAILDCKKQSINTGSEIYTSDFSILKESPVELLKKIILQRGVTPKKIEKFAVRMKVNLAHVLAQACLPHVPLWNKSVSSDKLLQSSCFINTEGYPLLVLNKRKEEWINPRHPDLAARELLKDLIAMIQDTVMVNNSSGIFTIEELSSVSRSTELSSWMEECSELAFVDLDLLQTKEEKLAFFVNVTNVAWLHAILLEVICWKSQDKETETSDFSESSLLHIPEKSHFQLLSTTTLERLTTQKILGYSVGQLGSISLFDLRYQLLHAQLPVPKHLEEPPFYQLLGDSKSIWEKYMPPVEPRTLFVLVEGLLYSPKLQVMYSEKIDADLEEAAMNYLDFNISIQQKEKIVLSKLLEWYALDFSNDDVKDLNKAPYEGLLNALSSLASKNLGDLIQDLFPGGSVHSSSEHIDASGKKQLPFVLEFKPPLLSFGIMLDYIDSNTVHPHTYTENATPIAETQPIVLNYLNDECFILKDLHEIFRSGCVTQSISLENVCLENCAQTLYSTEETYSKVPVTYLLQYYKNILVSTDTEHSWFSSALSPSPNRVFFSQQIEKCFSINEWHKALLFVDMYLECFENDRSYILLRELVLEHFATLTTPSCSMEPYCYALCINDPVIRANAVLQNVYKWQDISAVQTLKFCLSDPKLMDYPDIHKSLTIKLREVSLYKRIFDASEMYGDPDARDCVYVFNNWQEVAECSVWDQSRILDFIKSCERYELAVQWSELHVVNKEQKMLALSMSIIWYLTQNPPQEQAVFEIIDSFEDPSDCIKLCDMVLPELPTVEAKLCLVQNLVDNNISDDRKYHFFNMALGLKMLCALKSPSKESYTDLVAKPYLLLEQMLMNVELRDAEEALKAIRVELKCQTDVVPVMSLSSVNQLVEDYASKALEVHFLDTLLDVSSSSTLVLSTEETLVSDEPFMMPLRVPTKDEWVPDAKIQRCQVCKDERFNMFSRRHHCRRCGRVVCANCSQHVLIVDGYGNIKVRVCDDCYNAMTGSLSLTTASFEKRYRVLSSMRSSSPRNSPYQIDNLGLRRRASSIVGGQQAFKWVLSSDSEQNASVRNEFSYEQTPSISLCYSILKLHSDDQKCSQFMMNLCDRLLGKIKMRRCGKIPLEIDYSLIISMMKSLLMNAKVKCHQVQDSEGEALAELYFQHLDIIKLLVNANCRHLIPREAVTNKDTIRKLRDRLLEEERMNLALEVSTKFNLDKSGVWSSWGLFCLKAGDWQTARIKFQQCLKVLNDKNDQSKENPLLNKILKVLEDSKYPGSEKASAIFKSLASLKSIKSGLTQFETEIVPLDELIKKECLFYLNMYGTHFATVGFFHRHGLLSESLDYIIEKKCESDIFIEALFLPTLKNVQLSSLKHLITVSDPALSIWSPYLFATCRYLERVKYLTVLYETQLFMEDYARAAKSAINFYLAPAPSYKSLFERHRHLHNAKKHYEKYLIYTKESDPLSEIWKKRKNINVLSVKEVESYIQIIAFQEDITNFFKLCESQSKHSVLYEVELFCTKNSKSPPTLFGNAQMKSEVVLMVLINAVNVDEGFELASKILKVFNLDATAILCKAGIELVRLKQNQQIPHYLASVKCLFMKMLKVDDVILECVSAVSKQGGEVEDIIKMLTSDSNKINAYLMCGKLKSAYLLAIKLNSGLDVRRIMLAAEQCGQDSIQRICRKWLETNSLKLKPKEPAFFQ